MCFYVHSPEYYSGLSPDCLCDFALYLVYCLAISRRVFLCFYVHSPEYYSGLSPILVVLLYLVYCLTISRRAFSCVSMSIVPNIIRVFLQIICVILHSLLLDDLPPSILLFLCLLSRMLFGSLSRLFV